MKNKDDDTDSGGSPLMLSPSIKYASASGTKYEYVYIIFPCLQIFLQIPFFSINIFPLCSCRFVDPKTHNKLLVHVAFQVLVRPGSYKVGPPSIAGVSHSIDPYLDLDSSEWVTKEKGATLLQALLLRLEGLD